MSSNSNIHFFALSVRMRTSAAFVCALVFAWMLACPANAALADEGVPAAAQCVFDSELVESLDVLAATPLVVSSELADVTVEDPVLDEEAGEGSSNEVLDSDALKDALEQPAASPEVSFAVSDESEDALEQPHVGQDAIQVSSDKLVEFSVQTEPYVAADEPKGNEQPEDAQKHELGAGTPAAKSADLPDRFDAREQGWLTAVRQQNPWGSCWAIAAVQAMETNLIKQGKATVDMVLSPRHLLVFAGTPVSTESVPPWGLEVQFGQLASQEGEGQHPAQMLVDLYGENAVLAIGGNYYVVYQTVASGAGPVLELVAPYRNDEGLVEYGVDGSWYSSDGTWTLSESLRYAGIIQLNNVEVLRSPAHYSESQGTATYSFDKDAALAMKEAIMQYGSVVIAYDANGAYYDEQNNTFFSSDSRRDSHGVQVVGWDDSVSRTLFTTGTGGVIPKGDGAWIVRNSWGGANSAFPNTSDWGDDGYFYLSYYDHSIQAVAAYDVMLVGDPGTTNIINQYDFFGQMGQASSRLESTNLTTRAANVFTAERTQVLRAVSVDTYVPNSQVVVEVYLLDQDAALPDKATYDPTKGTLLERVCVEVANAGYHRIWLQNEHKVLKGQRFSVVQSVVETRNDGSQIAVVSIEAGNSRAAQEAYGYYHYDTVVLNEGESFFYGVLHEGETPRWMDATELAAVLSARSAYATPYGNFLIKLFSIAADEPEPEPEPAPEPEPTPPPDPAPEPAPTPEKNNQSSDVVHTGGKPNAHVQMTGAHTLASTGDISPVCMLVVYLLAALVMVGARMRAY